MRLEVAEHSLGKVLQGIDENTLDITPDGKRFAYLRRHDSGWAVVVDGKEVQKREFPGERPIFSIDGKRVMFVESINNQSRLVVDGVKDKDYPTVDSPCFSPDGQRIAFTTNRGGKSVAVVDGKEGTPYEEISEIHFSPDSKRIAYWAKRGEKTFVVLDGVEGREYIYDENISMFISFSPDSKRVAYAAMTEQDRVMVVDGKEIKEHKGVSVEGGVFSIDSARLMFNAFNDSDERGQYIVVDDFKSKSYEFTGWQCFSPDSKRVAYSASRDSKWFVVVDNIEGKPYDEVGFPKFSLDSKRIAYARKKDNKCALVLDGVEGKEYEEIDLAKLAFSPDGKHVAFAARKGAKWMIARVIYTINFTTVLGLAKPLSLMGIIRYML